MVERPRDEAGRALNPRPRDRFGRPLPMGSVGVPRIPDDLNLPPQQTLTLAQQLLDDGLAFNAHEVLEAAWKNGPFAERMLWQGLAQYAVGLTHIQRGNPKGARTLLTRAVGRLRAYEPDDSRNSDNGSHGDGTDNSTEPGNRALPYDIDGAGLIARAETLLAALDAGAAITEDDLKPRLRV
ncbi:DUF309 domain-containing protein [Nocardia xishanensis]|uniref:DUF309 domain-containing protein n=1 Tax=Nocardia xishanensis TaxID=238964 RepID=A0ABW7XC53_9NOCA